MDKTGNTAQQTPLEEAKELRDNWDPEEDTLNLGASGNEGAAPKPLTRKDERKPGTGEADIPKTPVADL